MPAWHELGTEERGGACRYCRSVVGAHDRIVTGGAGFGFRVVASVGEAGGVSPAVVIPGPTTPGQVHDLRPGRDAAEGERVVLAGHLRVGVADEPDLLRQLGADEDRDRGRVRAGRVEGSAEEHGERITPADDAEPRVHVVRTRLGCACEELLDVVGVHLVVRVEERRPLRLDEREAVGAGDGRAHVVDVLGEDVFDGDGLRAHRCGGAFEHAVRAPLLVEGCDAGDPGLHGLLFSGSMKSAASCVSQS